MSVNEATAGMVGSPVAGAKSNLVYGTTRCKQVYLYLYLESLSRLSNEDSRRWISKEVLNEGGCFVRARFFY